MRFTGAADDTPPYFGSVQRRRSCVAFVGALVATLAAVPARAETTYRSTVSPATIDFPRTRQLTYRLEITTGATPERLKL